MLRVTLLCVRVPGGFLLTANQYSLLLIAHIGMGVVLSLLLTAGQNGSGLIAALAVGMPRGLFQSTSRLSIGGNCIAVIRMDVSRLLRDGARQYLLLRIARVRVSVSLMHLQRAD